MGYAGDTTNDRKDNDTRSFRKAGYRQFILAKHTYLRRGNRGVCPSAWRGDTNQITVPITDWYLHEKS